MTDRTIQYARVDAEAAREIFIRSALVEGDWEPQHEFWRRNLATLERVAELEERARRRDIVVDDEVLFAFYDARIPPDVLTERHFDRWWRGERRRRPDLLTLTEELLTSDAGEQVSAADYPRTWRQGDLELDVTYQFSPGGGGRRRHGARARRGAQPGDVRRVRLAGAGPARRPRGRPAQVAAQGDPPPLRAHAGPRDGGPRRGRPVAGPAHRRAGPGARRRAPASASRRTSGT